MNSLHFCPQLFDFDIEVKPILEVLVGKTTEQALLEVTEEEELASLQAHQAAYQELRYAEIAELHRLEERERRAKEEKVYTHQCKLLVTKQDVVPAVFMYAFIYISHFLYILVSLNFDSKSSSSSLAGFRFKEKGSKSQANVLNLLLFWLPEKETGSSGSGLGNWVSLLHQKQQSACLYWLVWSRVVQAKWGYLGSVRGAMCRVMHSSHPNSILELKQLLFGLAPSSLNF